MERGKSVSKVFEIRNNGMPDDEFIKNEHLRRLIDRAISENVGFKFKIWEVTGRTIWD